MRHPTSLSVLCSLVFLGACASNPPPAATAPKTAGQQAAPAPAPKPVTITADTPESTQGGATFTAPAGWSLLKQNADSQALLTGPEPDLRSAVVDATAAAPDDAVAEAWKALVPDFKRPPKVVQPRPGRHGWDERRDYQYETSANEKLVLSATALRHAKTWTVLVLSSGTAALERRAAQVRLIDESLRPQGYTRESFSGKTPHKLDAEHIKQITDAVDHLREQAGIPGIGLALVQDGKVVYEGGLGVKELGKPEKVDAHTAFIIASNTKALTTLMLAKLVDQGKFTWETPVTSVYPDFKLGSADTTRQVLVKHLICACTGMPRQDMEWLLEYRDATPASRLSLLGTMQPTTKFGETFQYSNIMAAAAGFIGGHIASPKKELGAAFDDAMQTLVFAPLGMSETTFDFARALKGNHATAHEEDIDGKPALALFDLNRSILSVRPAGGAWSSVHDMAKYVTMELAKGGLPGGKRLMAEETLLARRKPQVSMGEFQTYGMGLMVNNEWGVPVVHHGGDMIGYHSDMFWLPDSGIGGVILTNGPGWLIRRAFIRKTLEVLFDGRPEAEDDAASAIAEHKAELAAERKRLVAPADAAVIAKLAKHYKNAALGEVTVAADGSIDVGEWKSAIATRKNDDGSFSIVTIAPGADGIEFVLSEHDGKRALILRDMQHEYAFDEVP